MADGFEIRITDRSALRALERLEHELPGALRRGLLRVALKLGGKMARNIEGGKKWPPGTRRLSRSFLVPVQATGTSFVLGRTAPVYAAIQEYGGTIRPVRRQFLTFEHPPRSGAWHSARQVTIPAKRYAAKAIAGMRGQAGDLLAAEIVKTLRAL